MFQKYNHKGTWEESLSIYLFYSFFILKEKIDKVSINDYNSFELRDSCVIEYNKWIVEGLKNCIVIDTWLSSNDESVIFFKLSFGTLFKPKVVLWSDRAKTSYYKNKLQAAFDFENYIESLLKKRYNLDIDPYLTPQGQYNEGENHLGIEIKNDTLIKKYGNIYIEYAEKSRASNFDYVPSGILKQDKSIYFLIGDKDAFWIFKKNRLVEIYLEEVELKRKKKLSTRGIIFKKISTSKGFVFPLRYARKVALSIEELVLEIKFKSV